MNDNKRPCRNCQQPKRNHNIKSQGGYDCEIECLSIQLQEFYYLTGQCTPRPTYFTYVPMDNLEYLEFEYQKEQDETPTAKSLR